MKIDLKTIADLFNKNCDTNLDVSKFEGMYLTMNNGEINITDESKLS